MKTENFANLAVNVKLPESALKVLEGMKPQIEWEDGRLNITFSTIVASRKPKLPEVKAKLGYENIPGRAGWVCNPNGNEFYGIPVREYEKGNLWVGNSWGGKNEKAVKVREDTDKDFLGVELPNGTVIEKIPQAPKRVMVDGETFEVWEDYKQSAKYRQIIADGILYVSPNLSMNGDKVQSVKAKENRPIVREDYPTAMYLASRVGYGEWESELMHDAEYSLDWIYQVYVKGDRSAMNNEYYLWLQTKTNNSSIRILARSIFNYYGEVGTRYWIHYYDFDLGIAFRVALKRSTDH